MTTQTSPIWRFGSAMVMTAYGILCGLSLNVLLHAEMTNVMAAMVGFNVGLLAWIILSSVNSEFPFVASDEVADERRLSR